MMKRAGISQFSYSKIKYLFARSMKTNPRAPSVDETLPEFVYVGKNAKKHTRVYVMGVSTHGGLGLENLLRPQKYNRKFILECMQRPHRLTFAETCKVVDVACGYGFTVLATAPHDGASCFGTGLCSDSQIGNHMPRKGGNTMANIIKPIAVGLPIKKSSKVTKVACGRAHTLMLSDEEGLWSVGNNCYGQCGRPIVEREDYGAQAIYHNIELLNGKSLDQLECGADTSFVLSDGNVYSCGLSTDGQTGRDSYDCLDNFGRVEGDVKGENVVKIACKGDTVLVITDKGDAFGWGNTEYRQLSSETEQISMPLKLNLDIGKITDVACSGAACFALNEEGDVYSWGYGILGRGPKNVFSERPQLIPATLLGRNVLNKESRVVKLFSGIHMAAAVTNTGGLYTWGKNTGGTLGLGHTTMQYFPLRVCIASTVLKVSCGVDHMAVLARSLD